MIFDGWFDDVLIYVRLSFGFLNGTSVLFVKLKVTPKKSTSCKLVTISILKPILWSFLIILFRKLSVC